MLKLPTITLIAFGSEKYRDQQQKALDHSCRGIEFGAVKNVIYPCNSIDDWNKAIIYEMPKYVETEFAILIHPDGFIVNPEMWQDDFLNYDYIGAPWPLPSPVDKVSYRDKDGILRRVGNSVSLRSKRLLDLPNQLNMPWQAFHGFYNEDGFICCNNVHLYEFLNMKIAPIEVAKYFSHETMIPEVAGIIPFAFHGHAGSNIQYPNFEI